MRVTFEELKGLVEAFIFSQPDPVSEKAIQELLERNLIEYDGDVFKAEHTEQSQAIAIPISTVMQAIQQDYATRGIRLCQVAGGWQFRTAQEWASCLVRIISRPKRLSRATLETLAIIAYHQPCTRADIEQIRGVTLGQTILETLLEQGLIRPCGHKPVPGRPTLWGTSNEFLSYLGLNSLHDLPKREELLGDVPYRDRDLAEG